ncbi:DNA polymerase subunit Cdc27 [Moelleriella libera RCEF 2490]|uniref:DNA polymerase subunit Cdc27 n=1 Tax=Moelleriella libera RCEF 2490 TaxID=1081109 RepID=A0A166VGF8_9HYPO|nr:DNA polymerase subunit Cdc27 [Moelleriella libera RCEF 2490]
MQSFRKSLQSGAGRRPEIGKQEETTGTLSDDGEADDSDILESTSKQSIPVKFKSRAEREEELRRMMDDEANAEDARDAEYLSGEKGGEDGDKGERGEEEEEGEEEDEKNAEEQDIMMADSEAQSIGEPAGPAEDEIPEAVTKTSFGRRRGKRRVTKKKRILDDQGYMVTIQEQGWESFSEDDSNPSPNKKPAFTPTPPSSAPPKGQKSSAKGTQGSIMSFFGKR